MFFRFILSNVFFCDIIFFMIAENMKSILESPTAGVIRKMFEEGSVLKQKFGEENVYDFSLGNPDLDPPEEVLNAIKEVSNDVSHNSHGYMQNSGYIEARRAMAEKTSIEQNICVSEDFIVMSCGAAGALTCVLKSLLNPGDEVIVLCPYFSEYNYYVSNHGGKVVKVNTKDDFSIDLDNIKNSLTKKTSCIILNSPNNPTGKIYSKEELSLLSKILYDFEKESGRLPYIILDEPYRAIVYKNKEVPSVFPLYKNSIVVTSFAKNLSIPGERLGYIAVNPSANDSKLLVNALALATRILGFVNAPAFFQKVISKSWNAKCDYSLYEKRCNEIKFVMDYAGLKYAEPDGAFYLFVKVPDSWNDDDMAFTEHLKKFNILCAPGSGFSKKGWFRISYCVSEKTILNSKEAFYNAVHSK